MSLPITDEVSAHVGPDLRGVLLGSTSARSAGRMQLPAWSGCSGSNPTTRW